jgi:hypothetical protein
LLIRQAGLPSVDEITMAAADPCGELRIGGLSRDERF